jgi:hypothetical protein
MYADIVKILRFVLIVLKDNDETAFKASGVYDIYRQFNRVVINADRILGKLKWKLEHINSDTSFGSVEKKWLFFNNQIIRDYEDAKHELLIMFGALESEDANPKYAEVFLNNFCSLSLNGKTNEYSTVAHIDDNFQLISYRFKFIENAKKVKRYRHFDELFKKIQFDLSTENKREMFIEETTQQIDEILLLLNEYEIIMARNYTINDLFIQYKRQRLWGISIDIFR